MLKKAKEELDEEKNILQEKKVKTLQAKETRD